MAKKTTTKLPPPPTSLTMRLGAPGMSPLHRAGLGGLAATLRVLDTMKKENHDEYPFTAPLWREDFRWEVGKTEVTLHFGEPQNAAPFLEWLFQFAFGLKDGLIFLPGQYKVGNSPPPVEVRARLQDGITLTFLQYGPSRTLGSTKEVRYDVDGKEVVFTIKECLDYPHQTAWKDEKWTDENGLKSNAHALKGQSYPGAVVRHWKYEKQTQIAQPIALALPLQFALVGTLSLPINRGVGVLLVPYIDDLTTFAKDRWRVTPYSSKEMRVASLGDAALQFEIRRRGEKIQQYLDLAGCDAIRFRPMPWSTQQKSRAEVFSVKGIDDDTLTFYDRVLGYLPSRVAEKKESVKEGRGKNAVTSEVVKRFWTDSVVRPFIADNVAQGKHWFTGFARWVNAVDPATNKPFHEKINFERKGFYQMIHDEKLNWKLDGAKPLVLAVQESLRRLYGKVASANGVSKGGISNRLEGEYDKWRLAFSGAKTAEQFRYALSDMFSRAKSVPSLQGDWESVTKLLLTDWEAARDLALIGLASYQGKEKDAPTNNEEEATTK
ncbi:MAG: type I-MYXAN CRISPR-associated Cas8a1/Cmx1 [Thermoguttaceae bacterium]